MVKSIYNIIRKANAKRQFRKTAILGDELSVGPRASCINRGEKQNINIGNHADIQGTVIANSKGLIKIGDYVTVRHDSLISAVQHIDIGNYVIISNHVTIMDNNSHPVSPKKRMDMSLNGPNSDLWSADYSDSSPIEICDNVWVGERAVILKGVTIGKGSIVACDAVVTKNIPPFSIVAGNPAKVVKHIENDLDSEEPV